MQTEYTDYINHPGLMVCNELGRILRHLPIRGTSRVARILCKLVPTPNPKGPCVVKTIHGLSILVDPLLSREGLEMSIFLYGTYEEGTLRIMNHILREGGTFIDIGANIGLMSLYAAKLVNGSGKVLSFEPLSSTYDILHQNIELNNFGNIEAVNIAIGSTDGTVDIFNNVSTDRGGSSLIKLNSTAISNRIPIKRLDKYLEEHRINRRIDCIKIDVEGWELEVLKGAKNTLSSPDAPICIIECSTNHPMYGGDTKYIYQYLIDINSYRLFRLARGKEKPSRLLEIKKVTNLPKHDNLFCFLPDHIKNLPSRLFI